MLPIRDAADTTAVPRASTRFDAMAGASGLTTIGSGTHPIRLGARAEFLPFSPHTIGEEEIAAVVDALRSRWITTGPRAAEFERAFAEAVGAPGAIALNSCTAGLHIALTALGIGAGDEVVTTPYTFTSSVNVIEHCGARPVFADVDPETLCIDPQAVADAITPRTRAILPVHVAGHPADMAALHRLADRHGLHVVEDAAHALPARIGDDTIGGSGNPTAFSFYATKNLTTAEGGMLTGSEAFLETARALALHGMDRHAHRRYEQGGSWRYDVLAPGFKYNMTDVAAAMGLVQLRRLDEFQRRRRAIVAAYQAAFASCAALQRPTERDGTTHAWHLYVIRLRPGMLRIGRDRFIEELAHRNIGTSVHFIPVHLFSYYRERYGYAPDAFPQALRAFEGAISLPLTPSLADADVRDVIAAVLDVVSVWAR